MAAERMNVKERYKYLRIMRENYQEASRRERSELLDQMEAVTQLHRKSLIRLMHSSLKRVKRSRERGVVYGREVNAVIATVWEALDYPCAERLTPQLLGVAQHLQRHGQLRLDAELTYKLGRISVSTVERRLQGLRKRAGPAPRPRSQRRSHIRQEVPMGRIAWDQATPGHFELDLVHHCGRTASGEYVYTVQMVDVATGWSELGGILGRSWRVLKHAFGHFFYRLPFPVLELHPDNGAEFFNHYLMHYFQQQLPDMRLSRSRPYRKNDNRYVEQRNGHLVRRYVGYGRLDTVQQTLMLNRLYDLIWLYFNFFQPVRKLKEKVFIYDERGEQQLRRRFDQAQTPFMRLKASGILEPALQARLQQLHDDTDLLALRGQIHRLSNQLMGLPNAQPNDTQDIFETLQLAQAEMKGGGCYPVTLSNEGTTSLR
jgi:hypothetical protein